MRIIAHRSGPTVYPEQTITSAKFALYCGADMAEVDVRYTKDKVIVASHDANVMRVFGVDRLVSDMTAEEFLALRHSVDNSFCSHLFEYYLKADVCPLLIHVKENEVIPELLEMLKKYDRLDTTVLGVMDDKVIPQIKAFSDKLKVLAFMPKVENIKAYAEAGADYIRLWQHWVNDESVAEVRKYPVELWIMTGVTGKGDDFVGVSTEEGLNQLLDIGVEGILINDVGVLQEVLEKRK
jgi:glycerophosphoryl diester phosphodiesterase